MSERLKKMVEETAKISKQFMGVVSLLDEEIKNLRVSKEELTKTVSALTEENKQLEEINEIYLDALEDIVEYSVESWEQTISLEESIRHSFQWEKAINAIRAAKHKSSIWAEASNTIQAATVKYVRCADCANLFYPEFIKYKCLKCGSRNLYNILSSGQTACDPDVEER